MKSLAIKITGRFAWIKGILLIFLFSVLYLSGTAQVLAGWDPAGLTSYGPSPWNATNAGPNLSITGLTRGLGVTTGGSGAADAWGGTGFQATTAALSIVAQTYVTFSILANPGFLATLTTFDLDYRRSGTGPPHALLQYSLGNNGFTDITTLEFTSTTTSGSAVPQVDLSAIPSLQNVPGGTIITFRIIPYGASGSSGTWYIYNLASVTDNLRIGGSLDTFASEPSGNVTGLTATIASPPHRAITLTWKETTGTTAPDNYLLIGSFAGYEAINAPVDGIPIPDGSLTVNLPAGTNNFTFTGIGASVPCYFKIFPYTNSGTNINYKTGGNIPQTTAVTNPLPAGTLTDPRSCFQAIQANSGTDQWVTGYIIGTASGSSTIQFSGPFTNPDNFALADDPFEVNPDRILFVAFTDSLLRQNLRLDSNPSVYHQRVIIHGDPAPVFSHPGMLNTDDYKWFDPVYNCQPGRWNESDAWFTGIPYKHDEVHIYTDVTLEQEGWSESLIIHPPGKIMIAIGKLLNIGGDFLNQ